ncbi:hypothetical protein BDV95DRAFT_604991 [Massariosphaeria phaeospora]|uniref:C2H2-type domain-containing protein n=1 Tax=Massariosphaeria phaeospora TaxID=100035 RepID=A0A7C8IC80_9PLEO|nr:hypothetical protein BDV95DRAFT_604991 [Massariosphaeria phaeospora]
MGTERGPNFALVLNAIDSAHVDRLRLILRQHCKRYPEVYESVEKALLLEKGALRKTMDCLPPEQRPSLSKVDVEEQKNECDGPGCCENIELKHQYRDPAISETLSDSELSQASDTEEGALGDGNKRKREMTRQRFEICVRCGQDYDVRKNRNDSCKIHPKPFGLDDHSDSWYDFVQDYPDKEIKDTPEIRKLNPRGFFWVCCWEDDNASGCEIGPHRPHRAKRARHWKMELRLIRRSIKEPEEK